MKHAGSEALAALADLIVEVRAHASGGALKEKQPGVFYRRGKAWLHFHEDTAGLFADLRIAEAWERFRVSDAEERTSLLALIDHSLRQPKSATPE